MVRITTFLCAAALFLAATVCPVHAEVLDRVVALVNGEIITLYEVNMGIKPVLERLERQGVVPNNDKDLYTLKKNYLDKLVDDMLLRQKAEEYKVKISDTDVQKSIAMFKENNRLTEEALLQQLRVERMTRKDFEEKTRNDILRHRLLTFQVKRKVMVTDEEVEAYFEAHKAEFLNEKTVNLALIVVPPDVNAAEVLGRIRSGEMSFEAAAREYSVGPGAMEGGDLGTLQWKELAPEWKEALADLKDGDVSSVFDLEGHKALLQLRKASLGETKPLDEVRESIRQVLLEPKLEKRFDEFMQRLRDNAVVDIKL